MGVNFNPSRTTNRALCVTSNTASSSETFKPSQLLDFDSVFRTFFVTTAISVVALVLEILTNKLQMNYFENYTL